MKLLTKKIVSNFKKQGSVEHKKPEDTKIIVKFFNPTGRGTWYATEWHPEDGVFFGFVSLFNDYNDELGYFSLQELEEYQGLMGLGIERDMYFGDHNLKEILEGARP
jgi:hypothetical protein